jgi:hypothetical protein
MLQLANTRFGSTFNRAVATGVTIYTEGTALGYVMEGGQAKVRPATGAAGEVFAGVSLSRNSQSHRLTEILKVVVPSTAPYSVTLPHTPITGEIAVRGLTIVSAAPKAGEVQLVGNVLTFNAAQAGSVFEVGQAFIPSINEAIAASGNDPVGGLSSSSVGFIGVIKEGDVFTDQYDVTADWIGNGVDPVPVYLGANGLFTTKTGGTQLGSVTVLQVPTAGNAFLGLSIRSAS